MKKGVVVCLLLCLSQFVHAQVWEVLENRYVQGISHLNGYTYLTFGGYSNLPAKFAKVDPEGRWFETTLPQDNKRPVVPIFFDEQNGIITRFSDQQGSKMLRTSDGGSTWELFQPNYNPEGFGPQILQRVDDQTVIGRHNGTITITTDRGQNWTRIPLDDELRVTAWSLASFGKDLIFTNSEFNGIYKTTDLGNSWEQVFDQPTEAFHMITPTNGYAIKSYGGLSMEITLYFTYDGWSTYETRTYNYPKYQWIYMFVITEKEQFGFFNGSDFYMVDDIQDESAEPELYQRLRGISPNWINRFDDVYFLNDAQNFIRLNTEIEATPFDLDHQPLLLYPNPTQRLMAIEDERFDQFQLISTTGEVLMGDQIEQGVIDLKQRASGIYIIRLIDSEALVAPRSVRIRLN